MFRLLKQIPLTSFLICLICAVLRGIFELVLPTVTGDAVNQGLQTGSIETIIKSGVYMVGAALLIGFFAIANVFFAARSAQDLGRKLRNRLYDKVLHMSKKSFDQFGEASLITRTSSDIQQIELTIIVILRMMLLAPALLLAASVMAYQTSRELSMTYIVTAPILGLTVILIMLFTVPLFREMQTKTDRLNLIFREGLTGIRVIRAFNHSEDEAKRFGEANEDFMHTAIKANQRMALLFPTMIGIVSLTNVILVWRSGLLVSEGLLQVGTIISFTTYTNLIMFSFMSLAMSFVLIPRAQVSAKRILDVLDSSETIKNNDEPQSFIEEKRGTIEFDHVSYGLEGASSNILTDISFTVRPGETLGIIGGTGSGKTTIVQSIERLHDITEGSLKVNGREVRDLDLNELRSAIGYVPQKANLFSGTIRSNLKYGNPQATDEEMWEVLEIAQAKEFVQDLDQDVEQGGNNFSGGQKQRLSIARALIKKADIYLFDDSFSALDAKTDSTLRQALKPYRKKAATIIISQKVTSIMDANQILVLENGRVAGLGSHDELMKTSDIYYDIVTSQLKEVQD